MRELSKWKTKVLLAAAVEPARRPRKREHDVAEVLAGSGLALMALRGRRTQARS